MKLLTKAGAVFDRTINVLAVMAGVIIIFIMLSITADVISRKLLDYSIIWVIEISETALVFIAFLGAAWLLRRDGHVKLDVLVDHLSPRSQALLNTITSIVGVIICLGLVWYGTKVSIDHFQRGVFGQHMLALPTYPRYAAIAAGSLLLFIQFIRRSYGYIREWRASPSKEERG
ncbi:TRAP transporter small permease subunit [Chloroflexota bacterium]